MSSSYPNTGKINLVDGTKIDSEVTGFKTNELLEGGGVFLSAPIGADGFSQLQTEVVASHDGIIVIIFCSDLACTDVISTRTSQYIAADGYQLSSTPSIGNFIKYQFTNTSAETQTDFYYTTKLLTTALSPQLLTTTAALAPSMVTSLHRTILVGQNNSGVLNNVRTNNENHIKVAIATGRTSYDEFPVTELTPVAQVSFPYNINTELTKSILTGSGTVTQSNNMALVSTSTESTSSESAAIESLDMITYKAGGGALARFSALFTDLEPNGPTSIQGIVVGDSNDGYSFMFVGAAFGISYRTNGVQSNIPQSLWNTDRLDGTKNSTNPSGMLLDPTKGNVYQISYGSGFGCVYFSVESQQTGDMILVHILQLGNLKVVPSAYNPTFPIRAEAFKDGTSDSGNYIVSVSDMSSFTLGKNKILGTINSFTNQKIVGA
tara:strand:- start:4697 stop:6001 length:1305 start_codon:yes stop_codon:yes gene_type:complete